MESIILELDLYRKFLEGKTSSKNVQNMYCARTLRFLEKKPEAMTLDEVKTRELIDDYIDGTPMNSAKESLATAVRYYWCFRFGKPYFQRYSQRDFPPDNSIDRELAAYGSFLEATKPLAEVTVKNRMTIIRRFLYTTFKDSPFAREAVTIDVVRNYLSYLTPQLSSTSKSGFATAIRSYTGFLVEMGCTDTARPISKLPLSFNHKRGAKLPGRIEDGDFRFLVESIDPSSERGARDLALILLMGVLGLRVSDAVYLELDDIGWAEGEVHVRRSKSKTPRSLPLDATCGAAIARYVKDFRPKAKTRRVFLVAGGEEGDGAVSSEQAGRAVKLAAEKAGISGYGGTHTLRRAVVSNMVESGVSIKVIADLMGHERISTAMGYLRLDLNSLREVAAEWPSKEVCHG